MLSPHYLTLPSQRLVLTRPLGPAPFMSSCLGCRLLRLDCDIQGIRLILLLEADWAFRRHACLSYRLRCRLPHQSTHTCRSNA